MPFKWTKLIIGLWIMFSPWILGVSSLSIIVWSNLLGGAAIVILSAWEIFGSKKEEVVAEPPKI